MAAKPVYANPLQSPEEINPLDFVEFVENVWPDITSPTEEVLAFFRLVDQPLFARTLLTTCGEVAALASVSPRGLYELIKGTMDLFSIEDYSFQMIYSIRHMLLTKLQFYQVKTAVSQEE